MIDNYKEEFCYPINACIGATAKCNLHCHYCFQGKDKGTITVSFAAVEKTLNNVIANRRYRETPESIPSIVSFYGGEPLMAKELIKQVFNRFPQDEYPFFNYSITTNGTLLEDKSFIQECGKARCILIISYDGLYSKSVKGGYGATRQGMKFLKSIGYPAYGAIPCVSQDELPNLETSLIDIATELNSPAILNVVLDHSIQYPREVEQQFIDILCEFRNKMADIRPEFFFIGQTKDYEPEVPQHNIRGYWPYFLHPSGVYVRNGISYYGQDEIDDGSIIGHPDDARLDDVKVRHHSQQRYDLCSKCKCQNYRCKQKIAGELNLHLCRVYCAFGDTLQTITTSGEDAGFQAGGKKFPIVKHIPNKIPDFLFGEYWRNGNEETFASL